jgi:hypothetical protein
MSTCAHIHPDTRSQEQTIIHRHTHRCICHTRAHTHTHTHEHTHTHTHEYHPCFSGSSRWSRNSAHSFWAHSERKKSSQRYVCRFVLYLCQSCCLKAHEHTLKVKKPHSKRGHSTSEGRSQYKRRQITVQAKADHSTSEGRSQYKRRQITVEERLCKISAWIEQPGRCQQQQTYRSGERVLCENVTFEAMANLVLKSHV